MIFSDGSMASRCRYTGSALPIARQIRAAQSDRVAFATTAVIAVLAGIAGMAWQMREVRNQRDAACSKWRVELRYVTTSC